MHKLGLALAGGGARASAHIGVLQALNENGIFPDELSGSSAGSMIAALYCHGYTPLEILELSMQEEFVRIFKFQMIKRGLRGKHRKKIYSGIYFFHSKYLNTFLFF